MGAGKLKYALHPGTVISNTDGQTHLISFEQLAALYGLKLWECFEWEEGTGRYWDDYVHLFPMANGDYSMTWKKQHEK